jgi:hypothetical protein
MCLYTMFDCELRTSCNVTIVFHSKEYDYNLVPKIATIAVYDIVAMTDLVTIVRH